MASPFTGPTAVADVIKDLDTQIAVSKLLGLAMTWHAGVDVRTCRSVFGLLSDKLGPMQRMKSEKFLCTETHFRV